MENFKSFKRDPKFLEKRDFWDFRKKANFKDQKNKRKRKKGGELNFIFLGGKLEIKK